MCRWRSQGQRALQVLEHENGTTRVAATSRQDRHRVSRGPGRLRPLRIPSSVGPSPGTQPAVPGPVTIETGNGPCSPTDTRTHRPCPDHFRCGGGHWQAQPDSCRLGWVLPTRQLRKVLRQAPSARQRPQRHLLGDQTPARTMFGRRIMYAHPTRARPLPTRRHRESTTPTPVATPTKTSRMKENL